MQKLLLIILLFISQIVFAQRGFIYVKKHGYKKVKSFPEGSSIIFTTKNGQVVGGILALVKNDSLLINNNWYVASQISKIFIRPKPKVLTSLLLTTGGVALSTAGMTLAKWGSFDESLKNSMAIGYGNFLIRNWRMFKRQKYNIGKKFSVQTLDLHF